jgi:hypothetical protein
MFLYGKRNYELGAGFSMYKRIISAIMRAESVNEIKSNIILRDRRCHIIVLNMYVPIEDKTDDVQASFYEEVECVFNKFLKYHMKILSK